MRSKASSEEESTSFQAEELLDDLKSKVDMMIRICFAKGFKNHKVLGGYIGIMQEINEQIKWTSERIVDDDIILLFMAVGFYWKQD